MALTGLTDMADSPVLFGASNTGTGGESLPTPRSRVTEHLPTVAFTCAVSPV